MEETKENLFDELRICEEEFGQFRGGYVMTGHPKYGVWIPFKPRSQEESV